MHGPWEICRVKSWRYAGNGQAYIEYVGDKGDNTIYRHHEQEPNDVCRPRNVSVWPLVLIV